MKYKVIEEYLDELIPNPVCELHYENDYTLLISIVLSAQTTDKKVNQVTKVLFDKYCDLLSLMNASLDDLKQIIRPLGNYNKKASFVKEIACLLHTKYHDIVPIDEEILLTFPGVGRKTVNVFLSEFKGIPKIAVDTHVLRVSKRLNLSRKNTPIEVEKSLMRHIDKNNWGKRHLQLVLFGRYHCKAIKPNCSDCKLQELCNYSGKNDHIK